MKQKHPRAAALAVAKELCEALKPACERLIVAGSLRRRKEAVGDVEIVFVPKTHLEPDPNDLFAQIRVSEADKVLDGLLQGGRLRKRENVLGRVAWGQENRLAVHVASGIPVDLFITTEPHWWNYLVCRTGPAESNTRIAAAAKARGWMWHPTGSGFEELYTGRIERMDSEEAVFNFVGFEYKQPWER